MLHDDERKLMEHFVAAADAGRPPHRRFAHLVVGMNEKRAEGVYEKWIARGWADCGVSLRTTWATPKGIEGMRRTLAAGRYHPEPSVAP